MRRWTWLIALVIVTAALPAAAGPREDAARTTDQGVARYRAGDYRGALGRFELAYQQFPSPKILFNIAITLEALGRPAEAAHAYRRFNAAMTGARAQRTGPAPPPGSTWPGRRHPGIGLVGRRGYRLGASADLRAPDDRDRKRSAQTSRRSPPSCSPAPPPPR
jgi:hypothetical protein